MLISKKEKYAGLIIFVLMSVSFTWLCSTILEHIDSAVKKEIVKNLSSASNIISSSIDPNRLSKIRKSSFSQDFYIETVAPLKDAIATTQDVSFAYTVRLSKENQVEFVLLPLDLNLDDDELDFSVQVFDLYEHPPDELIDTLLTGSVNITPDFYQDKFGSFMSAYTPILSNNGEILGAIGVDISYEKYQEKIQPLATIALYGWLIGIIFSFLMASIASVARDFSNHLEKSRSC